MTRTRKAPPPRAVRGQFEPLQVLDSYVAEVNVCDRTDLLLRALERETRYYVENDYQDMLDDCYIQGTRVLRDGTYFSPEDLDFIDQIEEILSEDGPLTVEQIARLKALHERV